MKARASCVALCALGLGACGGGGGGGANQSCTPGPTASLTITDTGFSGGNNACVQLSGQVTFRNTGSSAHDFNFDTPGCPAPGRATVSIPASSDSAPVTFPATVVNCSFHVDGNTSLAGTVAVTNTTVSGGGY